MQAWKKSLPIFYFLLERTTHFRTEIKASPAIFSWFLNKNKLLYRKVGSKRIADNALVALTLVIVESKSEEMEMVVKVIVKLDKL